MDSLNIENAPNLTICRLRHDYDKEDFPSEQFKDSPILVEDIGSPPHTVRTHPLVWCNNKDKNKTKDYIWCRFCYNRFEDETGYYYLTCEELSQANQVYFHKQCIKRVTNNPYHPKHSLQVLIFRSFFDPNIVCYCCNSCNQSNFYCSICNFCICHDCEAKPPLLTIDHKERHEHTLFYIPREASMTCDVCALDDRRYFLYICHQCDFVVHKECVYSPHVIKISRHEHRLSFVSSFLPQKWFCGVCRKRVDGNYGGYSCCYFIAHSRCALHKDVWDGKELKDEPEEIYEDISPFKEIASGIIKHFSHEHQMRLHKEIDEMTKDNKRCQACTLPIYNGDIFSCIECEFVLHKVCANLPVKKQHVMHPHSLVLQVGRMFSCSACNRQSNSFTYICQRADCIFHLDINCATTSEPLNHPCHPHLLFLPSNLQSKRICSICKAHTQTRFDCGECDFILCFCCATLPIKYKYKHDEHLLTFSYGQDTRCEYWCDVCEEEIYLKNGIYMCGECDITLHVECLLGKDMYILPGKDITIFGGEENDILPNNRLTRYICKQCNKRCQNKIVYKGSDEAIYCSMECLQRMSKKRIWSSFFNFSSS